jgi:hypothetical protein
MDYNLPNGNEATSDRIGYELLLTTGNTLFFKNSFCATLRVQ